jgi:hypothetical protein
MRAACPHRRCRAVVATALRCRVGDWLHKQTNPPGRDERPARPVKRGSRISPKNFKTLPLVQNGHAGCRSASAIHERDDRGEKRGEGGEGEARVEKIRRRWRDGAYGPGERARPRAQWHAPRGPIRKACGRWPADSGGRHFRCRTGVPPVGLVSDRRRDARATEMGAAARVAAAECRGYNKF